MAYNLRYYNEFTSLHYQRLVRVEILERDYAGAAEFLKGEMGASLHLSDSGDGREEPIKKLTASLRLLSTRNMKFEHLFTSDDKKFLVKIIRNGITIFNGFLESDSYSEPYYSYKNYTVNLTARDNLGRLETIPYLDESGDRITGLSAAAIILNNVLGRVGYSLDLIDKIGLFSSDMFDDTDTTLQTYINNDAFWNFEDNEPLNCLDVLTNILTGFGAQIRQINSKWQIVDQAKYYNQTTVQGNSATYPTYLAETLNFTPVVKDFKWIGRDSEMTILPAWKEFTLEQDYNVPDSVYNVDFLDDNSFINEGDKFLYDTNKDFDVTITGVTPRDDVFMHFSSDNKLMVTGAARVNDSGATLYGAGTLVSHRCIVLTNKVNVKSSSRSYSVKMNWTILNKTYDANYNLLDVFGGVSSSASVALVLKSSTKLYAITDDGWTEFASIEAIHDDARISSGLGISAEKEYIFFGFPEDGELSVLVGGASISFTYKPEYVYSYFTTQLDSVVLNRFEDNEGLVVDQNIKGVINNENNLNPDSYDLIIGNVPVEPNSSIVYLGGLFTASGVSQVDWKREGDTTAENLLKKVAIGYGLQNRQPARQVNGTVIWDYDLWTNIDDQNKRLMINSADWDMNTDEMNAEFVEVFEYINATGEFNDDWNDDWNTQDDSNYSTNTIFTLTEKTE